MLRSPHYALPNTEHLQNELNLYNYNFIYEKYKILTRAGWEGGVKEKASRYCLILNDSSMISEILLIVDSLSSFLLWHQDGTTIVAGLMNRLASTANQRDYYGSVSHPTKKHYPYLRQLPPLPQDKVTTPPPTHSSSTNTLTREDIICSDVVIHSSKRKRLRPSLSQQLLSIQHQASDVTRQLQSQHSILQATLPLFTLPARSFSVGNLPAKYPSLVHFFSTHCEYIFYHPYEPSQILMIMHYAHMEDLTVKGTIIRFRLRKDLVHFLKDYDPRNRRHSIQIQLAAETHLEDIKKLLRA